MRAERIPQSSGNTGIGVDTTGGYKSGEKTMETGDYACGDDDGELWGLRANETGRLWLRNPEIGQVQNRVILDLHHYNIMFR